MTKIARLTFAVGSIAFIFIGLLHSYVHFTELAGADLQLRFQEIGLVALQGNTKNVWDLFQGVSILMGFFSIAFGSALLGVLGGVSKSAVPNAFVCLSAIVLLLGIAIVGGLYLSSFQVIGGIAGTICFGIPLFVRINARKSSTG